MKYTLQTEKGRRPVDTDKIAKCFAAGEGLIMTDRDFYLLYSLCSLFESF